MPYIGSSRYKYAPYLTIHFNRTEKNSAGESSLTSTQTDSFVPCSPLYLVSGTDTYYQNVSVLLPFRSSFGADPAYNAGAYSLTASTVAGVTIDSYYGHFDGSVGSGIVFTSSYQEYTSLQYNDWTIEFWIDPEDLGIERTLFRLGANDNTTGILIKRLADGSIEARVGDGFSTWNVSLFGGSALTGGCTHIALTRQTDSAQYPYFHTFQLWVNGELIGTRYVNLSSFFITDSVMYVGRGFSGNSFFGTMYDFRITRNVARYTAPFSISSATEPRRPTFGPSDPDFANVVLLIPGDGTLAATSFPDKSPNPKAVSSYLNAQLATNGIGYTYGKTSIALGYASGNYGFIDYSSSSDFDIGSSSNFTIEFTVAGDVYGRTYISRSTSGLTAGWSIGYQGTTNKVFFAASVGGTWTWDLLLSDAVAGNFRVGSEYWPMHVAVVRQNTSTLRLYINGIQRSSTTIASNIDNASEVLRIGEGPNNALSTPAQFYGGMSIDNIRITNNVCRYPDGTTFEVPRAPFSTF